MKISFNRAIWILLITAIFVSVGISDPSIGAVQAGLVGFGLAYGVVALIDAIQKFFRNIRQPRYLPTELIQSENLGKHSSVNPENRFITQSKSQNKRKIVNRTFSLPSNMLRKVVFVGLVIVATFSIWFFSKDMFFKPSNSKQEVASSCTLFKPEIDEIELFVMQNPPNEYTYPSSFEIGQFGLNEALNSKGIKYESPILVSSGAQKFMEIAGQCLSLDAKEYMSKYLGR